MLRAVVTVQTTFHWHAVSHLMPQGETQTQQVVVAAEDHVVLYCIEAGSREKRALAATSDAVQLPQLFSRPNGQSSRSTMLLHPCLAAPVLV